MFTTRLLSLATLFVLAGSVVAQDDPTFNAKLNITNNCPITIPLWIGGQHLLDLTTAQDDAIKSFYLHKYKNNDVGYFYTDANGGDGETGDGTLRVAFFMDRYWLLKDPQWINIGMTVTPNHKPHHGFCVPARCKPGDCDDQHAYPTPPPMKRSMEILRRAEEPAEPPLYTCPEATIFTVTLCPDGTIPNPAT